METQASRPFLPHPDQSCAALSPSLSVEFLLHCRTQGAFVVCAVKDEGPRAFTEAAQQALFSLGAEKGLLSAPYSDSYLLIGAKGFEFGQALERSGRHQLKK